MIASDITTIHKSIFKKLLLGGAVLLFILPINLFSQISWERIFVPDTVIVRTIVVDSIGSIYIGTTGTTSPNTNPFYGIYKSLDHGISWTPCGFRDTSITSMEIGIDGSIYASSTREIYRSNNSGENWNFLTNRATGNICKILVYNHDTLYAGGWSGIIRSFNGGIDWDTVVNLSPTEAVYDICIDKYHNLIYGKTKYVSGNGGIYISGNWGDTWTKVLDQQILSLDVNSMNEIFASTGLDGVYFSSDLGYNWDSVFFDVRDLWSLTINDDDEIYVGCETFYDPYGGVYASYDNGQTWIEENEGLTNKKVDVVYLDPIGFLYAVCSQDNPDGKLFRSTSTTTDILDYEIRKDNKYIVYPNPLLGSSIITIKNSFGSIYAIKLFNQIGSILYTCEIKNNCCSDRIKINLPNKMSPGIYYLLIIDLDGEQEIHKIIKY